MIVHIGHDDLRTLLALAVTSDEAPTYVDVIARAGAAVHRGARRAATVPTLASFGAKKINTIKVWRIHSGMGLRDSKEAVERCPTALPEVGDMAAFIRDLRKAGATVVMARPGGGAA